MLQRIFVAAPRRWALISLSHSGQLLSSYQWLISILIGDSILGSEIWGKGCQGVLRKRFFLPIEKLKDLKSYFFLPLDVVVWRCGGWSDTANVRGVSLVQQDQYAGVNIMERWGKPMLFKRLLSCWITWSYFSSRLPFYVRWEPSLLFSYFELDFLLLAPKGIPVDTFVWWDQENGSMCVCVCVYVCVCEWIYL